MLTLLILPVGLEDCDHCIFQAKLKVYSHLNMELFRVTQSRPVTCSQSTGGTCHKNWDGLMRDPEQRAQSPVTEQLRWRCVRGSEWRVNNTATLPLGLNSAAEGLTLQYSNTRVQCQCFMDRQIMI